MKSNIIARTGVLIIVAVAPTDLLVLVGDREVTVKEDGKDVVQKKRAPVTIDAIMQEGGSWYIVLPVITKTQQ